MSIQEGHNNSHVLQHTSSLISVVTALSTCSSAQSSLNPQSGPIILPTKKLSMNVLSFCRQDATSAASLSALIRRMSFRRLLICRRLSVMSTIELHTPHG